MNVTEQEYECGICDNKKCLLKSTFDSKDKPSFIYCPEFGMRIDWYLESERTYAYNGVIL